ncbi:MAG TPA: RNA polymerase sigma factor [Pirellulales bacterium]
MSDAQEPAWPRSPGEIAALVDAYAGRLVRYAFRQLGDFHDAEDVVQQVFVRTLVDRPDERQVSTAGPYLYRAVGNACLDLLRRRKSAAALHEKIGKSELPVATDDPAEIAAAADGLRRAESLLARLPHEQAEAIRLRVFDGLALNEVADVLGCPLNTASSRLRYGFQKLRHLIGPEGE